MCFNISINIKKNIIENQMNAEFDFEINFTPHKHISAFSNPLIPVITSDNINKIELCYWGLIPHWVKDIKKANELRRMTYNAKCETIKEKPSFRDSIKDKKCLIIANGFYEWESTPSGKVCYYINSSQSKVFAFAGIWSSWLDKSSGEFMKTISIITQPANKMMEKIHNIKKRQPVILHNHNYDKWLNSGLDFQHILNESFNIELKNRVVESPLKVR